MSSLRLRPQYRGRNRRGLTYPGRLQPSVVAPSAILASSDVAEYWKASQYDAANDRLTGLKNNLHARLGSIVGADSNDPLRLVYSSADGKYAYLPGTIQNQLTVPHYSALNLAGDLDIDACVAMDDWTPGASPINAFFWKGPRTTADAYYFYLNDVGRLVIGWREITTTTLREAISTVAPVATDGSKLWVRATVDLDGNTGGLGYRVKFFTSPDGSTWTQLGADVTGGTVASTIQTNTSISRIGVSGDQNFALSGKLYRVRIRNGIDGPVVFDGNVNNATEPYATLTESSVNAQTVTFVRGGSGRKLSLVDRTLLLFGTDDRLEVTDDNLLDFAANQSFTVVVIARRYGAPSGQEMYLGKRNSAGGPGYLLYTSASGTTVLAQVYDGTNFPQPASAISSGVMSSIALVRDVTNDLVASQVEGTRTTTTDTTTAAIESATALYIGNSVGFTAYASMEFVAGAVIRRALTSAELTTLKSELMAA